MNANENTAVAEFIRESIEGICTAPHVFVSTAEALNALLFGLDATRRFCRGDDFRKSWHGFNADWQTRGVKDTNIQTLVRERLKAKGVDNPTEHERMRELIDVWRDIVEISS